MTAWRSGSRPRHRAARPGRSSACARGQPARWSPSRAADPGEGEHPVRVVVADDSVLLREGVVRLLEDSDFEVVGQAGDADDLRRKVYAHKPDVAVVDVRMPPDNTDDGLRAALEIRERQPQTGVLVLSQYVEEGYALDLVGEGGGGVGYLLKDRVADIDRFAESVRRVGGGGSALDPEVVARLLGRTRRDDPLSEVTPREREVLELMAEGRSNAAIAEALVVTERAVEKHVTSIFGKLGLTPTAEDHRRVLAVLAFCAPERLVSVRLPVLASIRDGWQSGGHERLRADRPSHRCPPALRRGRHRRRRSRRRVGGTPQGQLHRRDGPVGVGQVHADAHPRGPGQAHVRIGDRGRHRDRRPRRQAAHRAAPGQDRLRVPVLQPPSGAQRRGEHSGCRCRSPGASPTRR